MSKFIRTIYEHAVLTPIVKTVSFLTGYTTEEVRIFRAWWITHKREIENGTADPHEFLAAILHNRETEIPTGKVSVFKIESDVLY